MFSKLKKMFSKKAEAIDPVQIGSRYELRYSVELDPWCDPVEVEVIDLKCGWVRYAYFIEGKLAISIPQAMPEVKFLNVYKPMLRNN
jgi:hypothetical protein